MSRSQCRSLLWRQRRVSDAECPLTAASARDRPHEPVGSAPSTSSAATHAHHIARLGGGYLERLCPDCHAREPATLVRSPDGFDWHVRGSLRVDFAQASADHLKCFCHRNRVVAETALTYPLGSRRKQCPGRVSHHAGRGRNEETFKTEQRVDRATALVDRSVKSGPRTKLLGHALIDACAVDEQDIRIELLGGDANWVHGYCDAQSTLGARVPTPKRMPASSLSSRLCRARRAPPLRAPRRDRRHRADTHSRAHADHRPRCVWRANCSDATLEVTHPPDSARCSRSVQTRLPRRCLCCG
jgi:hypothetical protein